MGTRVPAQARAITTFRTPLFTMEEVLEITSGRLLVEPASPRRHPAIKRVCTDSRDTRSGDLFVALKGERVDGHSFVEAALRAGAIGALVAADYAAPPSIGRGRGAQCIIAVPDPLHAFQQLAAHHRARFGIPLVAVTGSNGKTTTKEMIAAVLGARWPILKTTGNLNNRLGVPMTLLRLNPRHKAAVVEMGVDAPGQTSRLCEITHPTLGVITNIGPDHLEFFGTVEMSAEAKGELLDYLPEDGAAVLNVDDAYFAYLASRARCEVVAFGFSKVAQVKAANVEVKPGRGMAFDLWLPGGTRPTPVRLAVHGMHNLSNALAAAAVGHVLGLSGTQIAKGLSRFRPTSMRSQVIKGRGVTVINDCYNANPASMKAALDLLVQVGNGHRTVAVLGDMLELGPGTTELHREVGAYAARRGIGCLITCGALGHGIAEGARRAGLSSEQIKEANEALQAATLVSALAKPGDVVLVKGSRGMKMECVVDALTRRK